MTKITLQNISHSFQDKVLFKGLSLHVPQGSKLLIRGSSGTGKSTLLKMILGFVKPQSGKVFIGDEELTPASLWSLRAQMAWVSQDIQPGQGKVTAFVKETLAYKNNHGIPWQPEKLKALLNDFGLDANTDQKNLEDLSGGELQRVALVVALLLNRPLYLLDEVTSALDLPLKKLVADHFCQLHNKTVVVVSHDEIWGQYDLPIYNTLKNE